MDTNITQRSADSLRCWPEDYAKEGGQCFHQCFTCGENFIGLIQRVMCKLCAVIPVSTPATPHFIRVEIDPVERDGINYIPDPNGFWIDRVKYETLASELDRIDAFLFGEGLSYSPDRALSIGTIVSLAKQTTIERDAAKAKIAGLEEAYQHATKCNRELVEELGKKDEAIRGHIASKNGWMCKYNEAIKERDAALAAVYEKKDGQCVSFEDYDNIVCELEAMSIELFKAKGIRLVPANGAIHEALSRLKLQLEINKPESK